MTAQQQPSDQGWRAYRISRVTRLPVTVVLAVARFSFAWGDPLLGIREDGDRRLRRVKVALVPLALRGRYRDAQPDLTSSRSVRARGAGCTAWGFLDRTDETLRWIPAKSAADLGAHDFVIRSADLCDVTVSRLGLCRLGIIIGRSADQLRL